MKTSRLEAFSDGVIAIIITITIMVLEIRLPRGAGFHALGPLLPMFLSYVLSFVYVGIYWNNHHHVFQATERVNGKILWANLHLLFWLSLIPFATRWIGEHHAAAWPVACYGFVLLMAAIAYNLLEQLIVRDQGGLGTGPCDRPRVQRLALGGAIPGRDWPRLHPAVGIRNPLCPGGGAVDRAR